MSSALAIAAVTQVLRDLLNDRIVDGNVAGLLGSSVTVSTLPPDKVVQENGVEATQLNLFLRHVTPNIGWRNQGLPSRDPSGRDRLSNPPLAVNLHYLISAYGAADLHAEILLGYAMQMLHECPVITRDAIRVSLQPPPDVGSALPLYLLALADTGLADQVEQLRITPEFLSPEEMSKFWTSTLAHYRPSAAYEVSVVLIQAEHPAPQPLPVLFRNIGAIPSLVAPSPVITRLAPGDRQPVVLLGKTATLEGHHLEGTNRKVLLTNDRFHVEEELSPTGGGGTRLEFIIPPARAADFPAGIYRVGARVQPPGEATPRDTNQLALTIAPSITGLPIDVTRSGTTASFTLGFTPAVRAGQTVRLVLGASEYAPQPFTASTTTLNFEIPDAPAANHLARLRVDGVDSPVIDMLAKKPAYLDQRIHIL